MGSQDFGQILAYVEGYELLAIDEAQGIPNIGMALKIIVDQVPGIRVIATGSSSLELTGQIGEPLTGRKHTLTLYPIAQAELLSIYNRYELRERLDQFLVFGSYPEVIQAAARNARIETISEIANSYLLKDILAFDRVRSSRTLLNLLKLLAFQIGSEVSLNELAGISAWMSRPSNATWICSRNVRRRSIRRIQPQPAPGDHQQSQVLLLRQRHPERAHRPVQRLGSADDIGQLWENFVVIERMNTALCLDLRQCLLLAHLDQQELDLVEERGESCSATSASGPCARPSPRPRAGRAAIPRPTSPSLRRETTWRF